MATVNNVATGRYGIVNLRKMSATKTGEVNIQYALNETDFASTPAQNGMLLVENHVARTLDLPSANTERVALVATVEKMYDSADMSLGNFKIVKDELLPRVYRLKVGDMFDTDNFNYDSLGFANYAAIVTAINAGTATYGYVTTTGQIVVTGTQDVGAAIELKAVAGITLPAGEKALTFVVNKA